VRHSNVRRVGPSLPDHLVVAHGARLGLLNVDENQLLHVIALGQAVMLKRIRVGCRRTGECKFIPCARHAWTDASVGSLEMICKM